MRVLRDQKHTQASVISTNRQIAAGQFSIMRDSNLHAIYFMKKVYEILRNHETYFDITINRSIIIQRENKRRWKVFKREGGEVWMKWNPRKKFLQHIPHFHWKLMRFSSPLYRLKHTVYISLKSWKLFNNCSLKRESRINFSEVVFWRRIWRRIWVLKLLIMIPPSRWGFLSSQTLPTALKCLVSFFSWRQMIELPDFIFILTKTFEGWNFTYFKWILSNFHLIYFRCKFF